ncbi:MAG: hypothetical protein CVV63_04450, partial [Tenericutes bacterium HGW-Tenericutes-8]
MLALYDVNVDENVILSFDGTGGNDIGKSVVIIEKAAPAVVYDPIYTVESISGNFDFNPGNYYGYIEVEGLYQFSDIVNLSVDGEVWITDGLFAGVATVSRPGATFSVDYMYIDGQYLKSDSDDSIIAYVTPGQLHLNIFEEYWGYIEKINALPISMDFISRVPGISGQTVFITNVDDPIDEGAIRASINAFDQTDGDITDSIVKTSDLYTPNKTTVGEYDITYSVTDSSSNVATLVVTVFVVDIEAPTIEFTQASYEVSYTASLDLDTLYTVSDNYDAEGDLTVTVDAGSYTPGVSAPGTYTVTYTVEDLSENSFEDTITVVVIDDVDPVITGPADFTTTISSGLTIGTILGLYSAVDAIDGNITANIIIIGNTFTANKHLAGDYSITIQVTDAAGNVAQQVIPITVTDDVIPVFYVTNAFISLSAANTLDFEDIIRIL